MIDVLLAGVPAQRALPAAVVPTVLAAGHAVQVEQDADAVLLCRLKGPIERVHRGDERWVLFARLQN